MRAALAAFALLGAAIGAAAGGAVSDASFTAAAEHPQTVSAVADWVAPSAARSVVVKASGGAAGYVRPGGSYHVYAQLSDSGNPPSGIATAQANASTLSAGQGGVPLTAGSFSADGASYSHRTAALGVDAGAPNGARSLPLSLADAAGNARTETGPTAIVDGVAPAATDVAATNGGSIAGRPDAGDVVTLTWSEPIDPHSLIAGWTGGARAASVQIRDAAVDQLTVHAGGQQLALGSLAVGNAVNTGTASFDATIAVSGSTVQVTLGAPAGGSTRTQSTSTLTWTPSTAATDRAGNPSTGLLVTESGVLDRDF